MSASEPSMGCLPSERAFGALLFETLFEAAPSGPRPLLAATWRANGDSTEWTIGLESDVVFHNGKALTPEDVVRTFQRAMQSTEPNPYRWLLRNLVEVTDAADATPDGNRSVPGAVRFSFSEPQPDLPRLLSCPGLAVLPFGSSRFEPDTGILVGLPPGTGPFEPEQGIPPTSFELTANEAHHMGRPFLDRIRWAFAPFDEALVEFQAGTAVLLGGIAPPTAGSPASLPEGTRLLLSESAYTVYLGVNPTRSGLRDPESRLRAMTAVDRSSMAASIVGASGRIARGLTAGDERRSPFWDYREAREKAASTGAAGSGSSGPLRRTNALPERELVLLVPRWHNLIAEIGDRIQVDLMAAGYSVRLLKVGREEQAFKLAEGDFDLFVGLWAPDRWREDRAWLLNHFRETQLAPIPSLASATASAGASATASAEEAVEGGSPAGLEDTLSEKALVLPLFHMDLVMYVRDRLLTPEPGAGAPPDLAWSWLRAGRR
jgi:ABC-type transport system substrate-binding protein